ncbi:hypothetical protein AKJ65_05235 [candidate division MSBL1 archaeon SCGC-AAA259E19]|uniref:ATP-binding protein n=1 Tax=candidate division MSBL1 archaeon SCGC-AAA259E19 TaxID=1698264 RepID=A0A133UIW2_9EURY|nr:hypothetical protein AKJ65_05235 [candidate division MSBL1 archaeon SCGC-AAA259E19]
MLKSGEWKDWLEERLEQRRDVYLRDSDVLISDFNREIDRSKGYSGRGLLELIQNADDAGRNYPEPNKLLIKLTDSGLFVANTGEPFSQGGVKSLIVSDNSPKQFRPQCIGYLGLGFRSVLNWTSSILILSGELSAEFDENFSSEFLQQLRGESEEINKKVKEFEEQGISNPIATLSVPRFLSKENIENSKLRQIYETGQKIKGEGYDTVICISLNNSEKRKQVQNEINSLFKEIVLFLRHLEEIEIVSPERKEHWRVDRKRNEAIVNPHEPNSIRWKIFEDKGGIPPEYLDRSQTKNKYEIKIAVPTNSESHDVSSQNLFVFFPTEVAFPFPLLAHATFKVTENRNHLMKSDVNRFVAKKLAALMAESAEEL